MFKKCFQRLRHQAFAVLFGIVLISACTVSAGAVTNPLSGDGYSLYNNIPYANLPSSLMDYYSEEFPFIVIVSPGGSSFYAFDQEPYISSDSICFPSSTRFIEGTLWDGRLESWSYKSSSGGVSSVPSVSSIPADTSLPVSVMTPVWSSFDILNEDGSIYFASSDPVSLDGYLLAFYDGSYAQSDLYNSSVLLFPSYVSPPSLMVTSFVSASGRYVVRSNSEFYPNSDYGDRWGTDLFFSTNGYSVGSSSYPLGSYFSDTSYFYGDSNHPTVFAFQFDTSAPGIDFSQTSLSASNPEYDYQSAEFDVSWSNLPEISYPDDIQYFLRGRLSDGAASRPPEIYLGSSDDPPEASLPVSFSFTDLQPETQYSATFELVYNDTGNFRDFISSGVSTTVSFTTLSDGSISEGDKAIINAIQQGNKDNQQWTDSQFGSAVGDLPEDTAATDSMMEDLDQKEEAYKDDAYARFQELSSSFSGFDGTVGSGIGLAGTLFSRFFNALGTYKIIYTFPLLLGLAMVLIGRLGRSMIRTEREQGD